MENKEILTAFRDWLSQNHRMLFVGEPHAGQVIETWLATVRRFGAFIDPIPLSEGTYAEANLFQGDRKVIELFLVFKNNTKRAGQLRKEGVR